MIKKKQFLPLIIILVLSLALTACGNEKVTPTSTTVQATETVQATVTTEATTVAVSENDVVKDAVYEYVATLPTSKNMVQVEDFINMVQENKDIFILDIRKAADYESGHVKGAINVPYGTGISESLDKLPSDKPIMVYCYTAQTSNQVITLLRIAGFDAYNVFLGWNRGLSKNPNFNQITETTINDFPKVTSLEIKPEIRAAIENYFEGLKNSKYPNYTIKAEELAKFVEAKDESYFIVDLRRTEDVEKMGRIGNAVNHVYKAGMEQNFESYPKDKIIVTFCYTGQGSGQTTALLSLLGYEAYSLNSGVGTPATDGKGWISEGFPVIK